MSYEIIYGNIGIDLQNGKKLVMLLSGSNNTHEFINGRYSRDRSWFPIKINGNTEITEEELAEFVKGYNDNESTCFMKNNKWLTNKSYGSLLSRTFNNAKSIEEIMSTAKSPRLPLLTGKVYEEQSQTYLIDELLRTTEQVNDYLTAAKKYKNAPLEEGVVSHSYQTMLYFLNREQIVLKKPVKDLLETDKKVVIKNISIGYVGHLSLHEGGYSSKLTKDIQVFNGSKEALDYLKKYKRDLSEFKLVRFNEDDVVKYNIALYSSEQDKDENEQPMGYLHKVTKNGVRFSSYRSSATLYSKNQFKRYEKEGNLLTVNIKRVKLVEH